MQVIFVHIYTGDAAVVVGGVVVNPLGYIAAACILGDFELPIGQLAAATNLADGIQNVEKLSHTFGFGFTTNGIELRKCGADKTGLGRQIPRQTNGAHATADGL